MSKKNRTLKYAVLDVFSTERYKGNPLAVVYTMGNLELYEYEKIAREFGYSETSFAYLSPEKRALQVRSFSPAGIEVDGAGHNLLGAICAALIKQMDIFNGQEGAPFVIMKDTPIPVFIEKDEATQLPHVKMRQRPARIGRGIDAGSIAPALNIPASDIAIHYFVPTVAQTEVAHLMIHVKDISVLNKIVPDSKALIALSKQYGFDGFYPFALSPGKDHIAESRFFNPLIGIEEDAATGTAAGPLTGILYRHQLIHKDKTYRILQGEYLNQPSLIEVIQVNEGILVGGSAVITMEGELYL